MVNRKLNDGPGGNLILEAKSPKRGKDGKIREHKAFDEWGTYCYHCGQEVRVAKGYFMDMMAKKELTCGCCHSSQVVPLSPYQIMHRVYVRNLKPEAIAQKDNEQREQFTKMVFGW